MSEVINYDNMGNINQLSRNGGLMNQYYYNGNRLDRIDNVAGTYVYDANGNATTDGRNGMALSYNLLNLPSTVSGNGKVLSYIYDAGGSKLRKIVTENGSTNVREYIDGIEYDGNNIDIIHTEEGVAQRNGDNSYSYHYNLSDHLGNVRYTFDIYNNQIRQLQVDNYFPFGKRNPLASGNNKYLYNGKEIQDELGGQIDYGARFYDPEIGRWNVVYKLADHPNQIDKSTYAYAWNNPIKLTDPDGNCPACIIYAAEFLIGTIAIITAVHVINNGRNYINNNSYSLQRDDYASSSVDYSKAVAKKSNSSNPSDKKSTTGDDDTLQGGDRLPDSKIKSPPAKRGNAPVGDDGKSVELHHREQTPDGPIAEKTREDHRGGENYKKNHTNTGQEKSKIDRGTFKKQREQHWQTEWDKGRWEFNSDGTRKK